MPLNFNGTAMKAVKFNGSDMKIVNRNGTQVWNKELRVYDYGTEGVTLTPYKLDYVDYDGSASSVTKKTNNIVVTAGCAYGNWSGIAGFHTPKIDVTHYSKLIVVVSGNATNNDGALVCEGDNHAVIGLSAGANMSGHNPGTACEVGYKDLNTSKANNRTVEWDISGIKGTYHINVHVEAYKLYHYQNSITIHSIILT